MEQVYVGRSGLKVSAVGLGCNNFGSFVDADGAKAVVRKALDLGVNFFDTADFYGLGVSEEMLGAALVGQREKAVIITKFGLPMTGGGRDTSRGYVLRAVEASLKRLQTDYIDLYMLHMPDGRTPMDELLRALDDIITQGKARYIAVSNLAPWQIVEASWIAKELRTHHFIGSESEYSLLVRAPEKELLPALKAYGVGLIPYFPLASGMLTGKYQTGGKGRLTAPDPFLANRFMTERNLEIVRKLNVFATERGHSLLELAMSWLACQDGVTGIIAGATKPEQVEANANAVSWKLTPEELAEVDKLTAG